MEMLAAVANARDAFLALARAAHEEHRIGGYIENDPASIDPKCCDTCNALATLFGEVPS